MNPPPETLDHLVYFHPSLETGMNYLEGMLGTRPIPGGRHPAFGTRNALLGLGPNVYLELLSPDLTLPEPERGRLTAGWSGPGLVGWAIRSQNMDDDAALLGSDISPGARQTPDGSRLEWQLTDIYAIRSRPSVPFLINWGATPHPSRSLPRAGRLVGLELSDPSPEEALSILRRLGLAFKVDSGDSIRATIQTPSGLVTLDGAGLPR